MCSARIYDRKLCDKRSVQINLTKKMSAYNMCWSRYKHNCFICAVGKHYPMFVRKS